MPAETADLDRLTQDIRALRPAHDAPDMRAPLTPELLAALVAVGTPEGRWSFADALAYLRRMPDEEQQAAAIQALARRNLPHDIPALLDIARHMQQAEHRATALIAIAACQPAQAAQPTWEAAFRAARQIEDEYAHIDVLIAIAPHLRPELLREALVAARQIEPNHECSQAKAMAVVISHLPAEQQPQLWSETIDLLQAQHEESYLACALSAMAPYMPIEQMHAVIDRALHCTDEEICADMLEGIGAYIPPERASSLLAMAETIEDEFSCARVLSELLPHLSKKEIAKVLTIEQRMADRRWQISIRKAILPYLAGEQQQAAWFQLLDDTLGDNNEWAFARNLPALDLLSKTMVIEVFHATLGMSNVLYRAQALAQIAKHLPAHLLGEAIEAAQGIENAIERAEILLAIAPRAMVWDDLLDTLAEIESVSECEEIIEQTIPYLNQKQVGKALQLAEKAQDEHRWEALLHMIPHLAAGHVGVALALTRSFPNAPLRVKALQGIGPHLDEQYIEEAIEIAYTLEDTADRVRALSALIVHLPAEQQAHRWHQVLAEIQTAPTKQSSLLQDILAYLQSEHVPTILQCIEEMQSEREPIAAIIQTIIPALLPEQLDHALDVVRRIESDWHRTRALAYLSPRLPDEQRAEVLDEALSIAYGMSNDFGRTTSLLVLVELFPSAQQETILREALHSALSDQNNLFGLADLLEDIAPRLDKALMEEALDAIATIEDEERRTEALFIIARHLYTGQQDKALAIALAIADPIGRARVLAALAPHLSAAQLDMALEEAHDLVSAETQFFMIQSSIPYLNEEQRGRAQEIIHSIKDDRYRTLALQTFAQHMPAKQRAGIMREALHIALNMQHRRDQMITGGQP